VLRDMLDAEGGFYYSAEECRQCDRSGPPEEKGEGAFYIWKQAEIEAALGAQAAKYFNYQFGVEPNGNVREDPQHEFTGKNILFQAHSTEETAEHFEKPIEDIAASIAESKSKLLALRSKRVRPHLDDKVLTAWNGLMISAFAKGGAILGEPRYIAAARRAAASSRAPPRSQNRRSAPPLSSAGCRHTRFPRRLRFLHAELARSL